MFDPLNQFFKNRKARRVDAAIERRRKKRPAGAGLSKRALDGKHFRLTHVNWFVRLIREMKGNKRVEKRVLDGKLDRFLPQPE